MTNEELVALIQNGERDKLPELWAQVEKFVALQANKRHLLSNGLGGVEVEDLYQSGYIALVCAADTYDPAAGRSFIGWLALALKTAFAEAGGYRGQRQARDPLHRAGSMDTPMGDDEDCGTLGDLIADPSAAQAFQDAEDQLYMEHLRSVLENVLGKIPVQQADILRRRFYQNQGLKEIAAAEGVYGNTVRQWQEKGLRALRRPQIIQELRQFVEGRTPYYLQVGVSEFQRTGESAVEKIVIGREQLAEQRETRAASVGGDTSML